MTSASGDNPGRPLSQDDARLKKVYATTGAPVDELPYSPEIDKLLFLLGRETTDENRHLIFHRLLNLRKSGKIKSKARFGPIRGLPVLSEAEIQTLSNLVTLHAGSIGKRDRLPYTPAYELVKSQFEQQTGRQYENSELWRLILRRAKRPAHQNPETTEPEGTVNSDENTDE